MNDNEAGNPAGFTKDPGGSGADRNVRRAADVTGSTVAAIWRGQEQLWQRILVANSSTASPRNVKSPVFRGAESARSSQVASRTS